MKTVSCVILLALLLCGANATFNNFINRAAQSKYAGLYRECGFPINETIIFNFDADGGVWAQFVISDLNPVQADLGLSIGSSPGVWEIIDTYHGGVQVNLHFIEYLRDPNGILNLNPDEDPVCSPACYAAGIKAGRIDDQDFIFRYNEYFYVTDLNGNIVPTILTPNLITEREAPNGFLEVQRITFDDIKQTVQSLGGTPEYPHP